MSPITRAQLLRRALVGGALITFGELPELAAKIPEARAAPALARTAIPTTARMCRIEWLDDELMPLYTTPRESGEAIPALDWKLGNPDPNLVLLSAQAVQWEEAITGYSPVILGEHLRRAAVLPPQAGRHFATDDIVRSSHDGDCYLVRGKLAPDTLELQYIGFTKHDDPLTDPNAEAAALAKMLPPEIDDALEQRFQQHALGGRPLAKSEMQSFEQWSKSERGRAKGYDRW